MELFILVIVLMTLAETTALVFKNSQKPLRTVNQKRKLYVDTSALMDPRLLAVANTGFLGYDLIIPRSVTNELQLLADGKDREKRLRARAALDSIRELERIVYFDLKILDDELDYTPVDNRLLELAKSNRGLILTNDFNLQKVATTEHIDTLNLNALALVMRNEYLPGDRAKIKITGVGSGVDQGIGYLHDGTMVVVEKADNKINEEVEVEFHHINQTAAGTMMFARLVTPSSTRANKRSIGQPSTKKTTAKSSTKSSTKPTLRAQK